MNTLSAIARNVIIVLLMLVLVSRCAERSTSELVEAQMPVSTLPGFSEWPYMVYLPAGYHADTAVRYPVIYLLHGGGCPHEQWRDEGHLKSVADSLIECGAMQPAIVVCAEANKHRMAWLADSVWNYQHYFFAELMPYIETNYRVLPGREHCSVAGFSMGGGGAVGYALSRPDKFAAAYAISAYLRRQPLPFLAGDPLGEWRQQTVERANPMHRIAIASADTLDMWRQVRWTIDCGDDDFTFGANLALAQTMLSYNLPAEVRIFDGDHNWDYWREALKRALLSLQPTTTSN